MEYKGDLLIRDLWQNGTDSVNGMRVVNTEAKYHLAKTPEKCLQESERAKKNMYLDACLQPRRHLLPFVESVDGILGVEAGATLKMLYIRLATKWRQPYSRMCGYYKSRIAITFVRATHWCIQGSRLPAQKSAPAVGWQRQTEPIPLGAPGKILNPEKHPSWTTPPICRALRPNPPMTQKN